MCRLDSLTKTNICASFEVEKERGSAYVDFEIVLLKKQNSREFIFCFPTI